jgi:hypothetical protein
MSSDAVREKNLGQRLKQPGLGLLRLYLNG